MTTKAGVIIAVFVAGLALLGPMAMGRNRERLSLLDRTLISVKRVGGRVELAIDGNRYSKHDLNFQLAEMHIDASPKHRVFVMLDGDTAQISDIALVTQMAVNAGFTDIDVYVVFAKSGNMAQIVYGPVERISDNPGSRSRDHHESASDQPVNLGSNQN